MKLRLILLATLILLSCASCQKIKVTLAGADKEPAKTPKYTVQPEINSQKK